MRQIRKYFPFERVVQGMFDCFGPLFGVRFAEVTGADVWATGVILCRVINAADDRTLAYIYFDMFPRDGKYGHMMMVPLIAGRADRDGYSVPVTAIVGNFRAPSGDIPSLLTHDDVEGLFHEFGHALHGSLTRVPFASLAGSSVEWDFVETPSQALENWAWEPSVLDAISGNYANPKEKLPAPLRDRIIAARDLGAGLTYTRMLVISTEDMAFHTADGPVDITGIADRIYRDLMGIPPLRRRPRTGDHRAFHGRVRCRVLQLPLGRGLCLQRLCPVQKRRPFQRRHRCRHTGTGSSNRETCRTGRCSS